MPDPNRTYVYLPLAYWPNQDQQAWQKAISHGDILEGQGPAHHWRPATRHSSIRHYSRWLSFLNRNGWMEDICGPTDRLTEDRIRAYLAELNETVAPRTMASAIIGLKVMVKAMAPSKNWRWLMDISNRVHVQAKPSKDKRLAMRDSTEILAKAIAELQELQGSTLTTRKARIYARDCLIIALMAARPLRMKNFCELELGHTLLSTCAGWWIDVPGSETKTSQPIAFPVPDYLAPYLSWYIEHLRPVFEAKERSKSLKASNRLWLNYNGGPLTAHATYHRFILLTTDWFGTPINPHLFRDCAATTLSTRCVADAFTAAPLLGHRSFATTQKHYIRANQLEASRQINAVLADLPGAAAAKRSRS